MEKETDFFESMLDTGTNKPAEKQEEITKEDSNPIEDIFAGPPSVVTVKEEEEVKATSESLDVHKKTDTKEINFSNLRKERDRLASENALLLKQIEEKKDLDKLGILKPVYDKIKSYKSSDEEITDVDVEGLLNKANGADEELKKVKDILQEKEYLILQKDITSSDVWAKEIIAPLDDYRQNFFANIYSGDESDLPLIERLASALDKIETKDLSVFAIKNTLNMFASSYKNQTGKDYIVPDASVVRSNILEIRRVQAKASELSNNWESKKAEFRRDEEINRARIQEEEREKNRNYRSISFIPIKSNILESSIVGSFFSEKKESIKNVAQEEYDHVENVLEGKKEVDSYETLMKNRVKARMFDFSISKMREQADIIEKLQKKIKSIESLSSVPSGNNSVGVQKEKITNNEVWDGKF